MLNSERLYLDGLIKWITGKTTEKVQLEEYADNTYEVVNADLLLQQRYMPAVQFAYENEPKLVYEM